MIESEDMLRLDSANADDMERLHPWFDAVAGHLPQSVQHGMRVALEEVVMNAAMHGAAGDAPGDVTVRLRIAPECALLCVEDSGRAFDPTRAPTHRQPADLLEAEPGGLGLVLLHHYCHDITYQRLVQRNRVTMRFPLRSDKSPARAPSTDWS